MLRAVGRVLVRVLVATTIFLVVGEGLARMLHIVDRLNGYGGFIYTAGPDPDLPYLQRPNVETVMRGVTIRTNARGLRGPDVAQTPAPGVHRVLVLGDSVVFGQEMADDQTLPAQLQHLLEARGGRWEVVNGGISGYDTTAELRFLETQGLPLRPETVVVAVSLNDYDPPPIYSPFGALINRGLDDRTLGVVDRWEFLTVLRWLLQWQRGQLMTQLMARAERDRGDLPPGDPGAAFRSPAIVREVRNLHLGFYHAPEPRHWERMRRAFAGLARVADAHRLRLLVAIFPESYQVGTAEPDLEPQRRLLDLCRDVGLRTLDLQPAFAAAGGELFADVSHPNARGHAVAAAAVAGALATF